MKTHNNTILTLCFIFALSAILTVPFVLANVNRHYEVTNLTIVEQEETIEQLNKEIERLEDILNELQEESLEEVVEIVEVIEPEEVTHQETEQIPIKEQPANVEHSDIEAYVNDICEVYPNMDKWIILSIIKHESGFDPNASNGYCFGLMQIYEKWHTTRMSKLGVTDLFDPYSNILVGVDILNDYYIYNGESIELALMLYSGSHDSAFEMYSNGVVSSYALNVLAYADELRE